MSPPLKSNSKKLFAGVNISRSNNSISSLLDLSTFLSSNSSSSSLSIPTTIMSSSSSTSSLLSSSSKYDRGININMNDVNSHLGSGKNHSAVHPHHYPTAGRAKRVKKNSWGARERAGMSFLIVIAFFAVFGLIILTEVFMIDDKGHGGVVVLRHYSDRLGDTMPDYDNPKQDYYDLIDGSIGGLNENKLFRSDNNFKMNDRNGGNGGAGGSINNGGVDGTGNKGGFVWNGNNGQVLPSKIENTLPHYPIGMQPTDGSWQIVNGTRFKFFVFSAYYDRRNGKMIRVVGATKTHGQDRVWCRLWYPYKNSTNRVKYYSATVTAKVKIIRENWNLKYSAFFILCPLRDPSLTVPYSVSIVSRLRAPPGNNLLLRNTDLDSDLLNRTGSINDQIPDKMAICVKPFHFNYDQALHLIEFLEFYSLLGISHFTFYNHTLGSQATCVLKHYIDGKVPGNSTAIDRDIPTFFESNSDNDDTNNQGTGSVPTSSSVPISTIKENRRYESNNYMKPTVNILPWDLRMRSQKEIRTEGLFAALNDCLYRNMYRYKYLLLVDLDEFIIPRHNDTLKELVNWLNQRYRTRQIGMFSFQNAFFYLQFADDPWLYETKVANAALRAALVTQRKTRRRSKLHPQRQRSKYICKPEAVVEAGNHFVWEFSPGKGSINVPADSAILHHYRVCEFGGDDCIKAPSMIDRTATKYMNRLTERVELVYNHLKQSCNLNNLPPAPTKPPIVPKRQLVIHNNKETTSQPTAKLSKTEMKKKKKTVIFEESKDGISQVRIKYWN